MKIICDISGQKFGLVTAINVVGKNKAGHTLWRCLCDCGKTKEFSLCALRKGRLNSCGCARYSGRKNRPLRHGFSCADKRSDPIVKKSQIAWQNMLSRCNRSTSYSFKFYGGRGISVDKRWNEFSAFIEDIGMPPSEGHSLDRRDSNGPYNKNNCRWILLPLQQRNKRGNIYLEINKIRKLLVEWAEEFNVGYQVLYKRVNRGWTGERLLS